MPGTVLFAGATETATITVGFTVNGAAADPGAVTCTVTDPNLASTTYTFGSSSNLTKSSTGNYACAVATPTAGPWSYTWTGTAPVPDVQHGSFSVQATDLGRLYATPEQLKSRLTIPATDTQSDLELQQACRAASRMVEQWCQRQFWRGVSETRVVDASSTTEIRFGPWNDAVSVTAVAVDANSDGVFETTWAVSDWQLYPYNAGQGPEPRPYTGLVAVGSRTFPYPWLTRRGLVQVTGVFGWPQVPAAVSEATRVLAAEVFRTKDAPFGVASFGDAGVARVRRNPLVEDLLAPYRLPTWVV